MAVCFESKDRTTKLGRTSSTLSSTLSMKPGRLLHYKPCAWTISTRLLQDLKAEHPFSEVLPAWRATLSADGRKSKPLARPRKFTNLSSSTMGRMGDEVSPHDQALRALALYIFKAPTSSSRFRMDRRSPGTYRQCTTARNPPGSPLY